MHRTSSVLCSLMDCKMNIEDSTFKKWLPKYQLIIYLIIVLYSSFVPAFVRETHASQAGLVPFIANIIMTPLMLFYSIIFTIITLVRFFIYKTDPFWVKATALSLSILTLSFSYYAFSIVGK